MQRNYTFIDTSVSAAMRKIYLFAHLDDITTNQWNVNKYERQRLHNICSHGARTE